nr:unnamed protein product [Callosobruchus chinensis]
MRGHTGIFLKLLLGLSVITTLGHAAFQVALVAMPPYAHFLKSDPFLEKLLRHMGLVRLDVLSYRDVIVWLSPEILMLVISVAFLVTLRKLTAPPPVQLAIEEPSNGGGGGDTTKSTSVKEKRRKSYGLFVSVGRFCVLFALCTAAVLRPSVPGGLYFIIFLCTATWWAGCKQLRKGFAVLMLCLAPIVVAHLFCLYAYQLQWIQELLKNDTDYTRLFGLTPLYNQTVYKSLDATTGLALANTTTEDFNSTVIEEPTDPRVFVYSDLEWAAFVNPIAIYVLFYLIILEAKELLKPEDVVFSKPDAEPNERTPLIRGVSPSKRHGSGKRSGIYQDSTGSVTVTGDNTEDIPLDEMEQEYEPTVLENVFYAMESIAQLIVRSSYIGTNIIMMAWSITYLSWLTFILLIWANLIWLVPNQRRSMLRSSPFLVLYAWFLLISAYIYSMDVDLPSTFEGVDLAEFGFVKVTHLPCAPLFVKCLYTAMFWVTLRQYIQERAEQRHSSALADMAAPLQITVGAASAGTNRNNAAGADGQEKTGSKVMERIGQHLKRFLTKFWIWVVAITLFAVAITGQRMTGFRILYMALFLIFILSFQFSFQIWRKMMFGFWLTVIIYSMIILVMVYTYQFKNFPKYWTDYLHIPEEQQLDIGLEQFETTQLFVRLVTPTFFVIITVIQLHYFHNDFMVLSDPKNTSQVDAAVTDDLEQSSMQGGAYVDRSEKEEPSSQIQFDFYDLDNITSAQFQLLLKQWLKRLHRAKNLCYLFLELHMSKAVLLFAMLMCVYDKCALYFVIVVLISLALTFGRPMQTFAIYFSSLLVSVMLLSRMIYQIQYITPQNWDVNCTVTENPELNMTTKNNAPWFGFEKGSSLPSLVKWNIIYILVVTLWAVILVRQYNYRLSRGRPTTRAFFMFPNVKRTDADTNLRNCLKYLANYGYYKFGVEISLMMTVAVIGTRMDMYSVLYSVWLCVLFSMKRSTLSKVWLFYLIFLAIALPFQYFMAVGLPPTLCQEFPWDRKDQLLHSLQDWAYLLDNYHPPPVKKLVLDFILLLLVSRQWVVFRIEKRYARAEYAGGSNEVIIHHAEEKDFKNPVPDFITYARSYLDIFKRAILQSFLWITLAIVFLAGTNRTNIFSLGYLVGAFVFLWHGSDFYLKPIPKILKQWQWLLGYNVSVIFIKTAFQILGCIFIHDIPTNCCWLVQLLGIGCVRKFGANLVEPPVVQGAVPPGQTEYCTVPREFIGIAWDGLCFGLLIMQRRIFHSYNFFHIVDECKATTILASRGAELIEEIRQKMVHNQEEQEHRVLEKIKMKMDRIKANQQKIQASSERGAPPLAHSTSTASCSTASPGAGYHTPVEEDEEEGDVPPPTASSQITSSVGGQQAPPSPYSAVMTVSLEGYLEPQRLSFSSPPNSELNPRPASPDDSFPVFSPPPYNHAPSDILVPPTASGRAAANPAPPYSAIGVASTTASDRRRDIIGPPWMPQNTYQTPRQSVISYSSRSPLSHHESIRSGDYYMFDELDDDDIDLLPEEQAVDEEDKKSAINKPDIGEIDEHDVRSVRIQEEPETEEEPQPGTSKDEDISDLTESKETIGRKILQILLFIWAFLESSMISLTNFLNRYSRDYRYVLKVLSKEKKILKEKTAYNVGLRIGPGQMWHPAGSYHSLLRQSMKTSPTPSIIHPEVEELSQYDQPTIVRLLLAIWYIVMSRSEILCYSVIFLNQMKTSTLITLPLPMMVFFWGSLTIPRPSKTFWVTIIAYTEAIVLLKCIFQFDIVQGGSSVLSNVDADPLMPTKLLGLYRKEAYAMWDLLLLLVVFFHRVMLKSLGIWTTSPPTTVALLSDGEYRLEDGQLIPIGSSSPRTESDNTHQDTPNSTAKSRNGSKSSSGRSSPGGEIVSIEVKKEVPFKHYSKTVQMGFAKYGEGVRIWLHQLLDPTSRVAADVYSLMFLCDFINFFVILFGYSSFGGSGVVPIHVDIAVHVDRDRSWYLPQEKYFGQNRVPVPTDHPVAYLVVHRIYVGSFPFELRTCMDWMWTETSMTVFDWIKMEDIFAHIFLLKVSLRMISEFDLLKESYIDSEHCQRHAEDEFPQPRGEKKNPLPKYMMGGAMLAVIIGIIWFPLVFFSLGNAVGETNVPYDVTLEIRIGPYEPIYRMSAQSNSIYSFKPDQLEQLRMVYNNFKSSGTFINNYEAADIAAVKLSIDSGNIWGISPPDRKRMLAEINSTETEDRTNLLKMLEGLPADPVLLQYLLPKFIKVTNRGTVEPVEELMLPQPDEKAASLRNITTNLNKTGDEEWWRIREECNDTNYELFLRDLPYQDCSNSIILYTFNDKVFPPTLEFISVASRILRSFFADQCGKIMFEDLPNVDRVLQLCLDIYLVREACEFALEEDLFAKLVFLFRYVSSLYLHMISNHIDDDLKRSTLNC